MTADALEPVPTPDTAPFWEAAREGVLKIQRCRSCERHYFYPRSFCRFCSSSDVEWVTASGGARLVSYVINYRPAPEATSLSPVIAIVELDEGPSMLTNIVDVEPDPQRLPLDLRLVVAFEARGAMQVPVFAPAAPGA